jgi:hypothetical protein
MSDGVYRRRVTPMERLAILVHEAYRYHVDGVLECEGEIDPEQLRAAVERAAAANPGMRVRLHGHLGFSRWIDSGIAPQVRYLDRSDWDGNSECGAEFLEERFDVLHGGPIADVLLVPCKDGRIRIVFRNAHAAVDGRGCMHWMLEVCRALRGESLRGSPSCLRDVDIHRQYRDRLPPPVPPSTVACIPVLQPSAQGREPLRYVWRRVTLDRPAAHLLPKIALFLAAWARQAAAGPVAFTVPVDYRGLRTEEMGTGNLTGYLRLEVEEGATSRVLMKYLSDRIRQYADCRTFSGAQMMNWMPISLMMRSIRPKIPQHLYDVNPGAPSGGLVSMGSVRLSDYDGPGHRACGMYGIPGAAGKLNVLFVENGRQTPVLFAAPAAYNAEGQLDTMVQAFAQQFSGTRTEA